MNKTYNMKRVAILTLLTLVLTAGLMACGGARGGHCDAYGSIDNVVNAD
jgi:hypothetical protein